MKLALDNNIPMEDLILNYSIIQEDQLNTDDEDSLDNEDIIITQSEDIAGKEDSNTVDLMSSSTLVTSNEDALNEDSQGEEDLNVKEDSQGEEDLNVKEDSQDEEDFDKE